ncbi:MAG TPA: phosphoadenylyl-sulfate reductase [Acidimicrobiales bacterium]|jgi:phosphoadenosine phosphosulfate reductase|nr:phosphoadenylyl-sulfate reductase [Acidimicrobiales bacterium]
MTPTSDLLRELEVVDERFELATPLEILKWTFDRFDADVAMACSFEDVALLHMVHELRPSTEIIFLDTGGHFEETLDFADRMTKEWSLNVTRTEPGPDAAGSPCGSANCCELRKVEPLGRALQGRSAWITSVKRVDAPSRASMKTLMWDEKFDLVKVNPLATWGDDDVAYYLKSHDLPEHPLWAEGYASIGCAAMTLKPQDPGDRRSGRWVGLDKEECGLHEA